MIDATVTVLTLTPYSFIYEATISHDGYAYTESSRSYWTDKVYVTAIADHLTNTNVFSTPVIYFLFNGSYRVRILIHPILSLDFYYM